MYFNYKIFHVMPYIFILYIIYIEKGYIVFHKTTERESLRS